MRRGGHFPFPLAAGGAGAELPVGRTEAPVGCARRWGPAGWRRRWWSWRRRRAAVRGRAGPGAARAEGVGWGEWDWETPVTVEGSDRAWGTLMTGETGDLEGRDGGGWTQGTPVAGGTEGPLKVERQGPASGTVRVWGEGAVGTLVPHQVSGSSSGAGQDLPLPPWKGQRSLRPPQLAGGVRRVFLPPVAICLLLALRQCRALGSFRACTGAVLLLTPTQ